MKSGYRYLLAVSVCLLLIAPVAFAQTTGTIEGMVTDQSGGVLPGVTVEITSPNLQGTRTAVTGADGKFRFPAVPPGPYTVKATLSGFNIGQYKTNVALDSTATVSIPLQLATAEAITVTGEAPIVDVTSTTTGSSYTAKVMDRLPLQRNYADIVRSQPGVQEDTGETQGTALALSIYGSTSAENLFLIDGVNTTNVIKGLQGKNLNPEFIQEVEVKTGGYQAEYGRNTGGVINVITKSGGNEFHGDLFGYFNNGDMRADSEFTVTPDFSESGDAERGTTITDLERSEYGVGLGGYFWKDRIWFYGAYNRVESDSLITPLAGIRAGDEFPDDFEQTLWSAKLTFNIAQGTTLIATAFADPQDQSGAFLIPNSFNPNTYLANVEVGGTDYAGRLNQLFGSFGILTLQYAQHEDQFRVSPNDLTAVRVTDTTPLIVGSPNVISGGFGQVFGPTRNNQSEREQFGGSFTAYMGNHEIKLGADVQNDRTFGETFYTGGELLTIVPCTQNSTRVCDLTKAPMHTTPQGTSVPVFYEHRIFTPSGTDLNPLVSAPFDTPTDRWGAFLQDTFRITPALTINAGIRYDTEEVIKGNGETAFELKDEWAPRFGFTWDFVGDGSAKLYCSFGRFYYALPTDLNVRVFTANTQVINRNYSLTDRTTQDPTAPRARFIQVGSFAGEPVDAGTEAAYQDEFTLGVEKALDPTFSVGIKGTYRDLGRTIEDRCDLDYTSEETDFNACALFNPGGSGPAASGQYPGHNGGENPTDPTTCAGDHPDACFGLPGFAVPEAERVFWGVELVARKAFSEQLWAQASYLYSELEGDYSGAIRVASGQTDPGINADYDYNQFLVNSNGKLELHRPHQFRVDAVWTSSFGLVVGGQGYVRSGATTNRLGYFNAPYPDLIYLQQRGSAGDLSTDYEMNLSLAYNINVGKVTITPQLYVFNLFDRQTPTAIDERWNPNGTFLEPGDAAYSATDPLANSGVACGNSVCTDNVDYRKTTERSDPRLFRVALKLTF
jgi:hypothetical protein